MPMEGEAHSTKTDDFFLRTVRRSQYVVFREYKNHVRKTEMKSAKSLND